MRGAGNGTTAGACTLNFTMMFESPCELRRLTAWRPGVAPGGTENMWAPRNPDGMGLLSQSTFAPSRSAPSTITSVWGGPDVTSRPVSFGLAQADTNTAAPIASACRSFILEGRGYST